MHKGWTSAIIATVVISGMLTELPLVGSTIADAASRRFPASSCVARDGDPPFIALGALTAGGGNGFRSFVCPISEDEQFPKTAVTLVQIFGFLAVGTTFSARVCSLSPVINSSSVPVNVCSLPKVHEQSGVFVVSFRTEDLAPAWGEEHAANLAFVEISFTNGLQSNKVTGIFLSSE